MITALCLMLFNSPAPMSARIDAAINLSTITLTQARDLNGSRQRVRVRRYDNEWDGRALVGCWHVRDIHCLLILRRGEEMQEHGRFVVEGTLRVWNVPSYRIGGRLIEGWTMIRIERATVAPT
jgi:hypothetical protein